MSDKIAPPSAAPKADDREKGDSISTKEESANSVSPNAESAENFDDDDLGDDLPAALRAEEKAFSVQILQFFLFPLLLVITCLAIFFIFGIAGDSRADVDDLLQDIRQGGTHARRVAAHELANALIKDYQQAKREGKPPELASKPQVADTLVDVLNDVNTTEIDFQKFLFMAGSLTGDKRFAPLAIKTLEEYYAKGENEIHASNDPTVIVNDPEVEIYMALTRLADPATVAPLREFYNTGNADTRKLVIQAVGAIETPEAEALLIEALEDESVNVYWNAATRLAARKNPAAKPMVLKLLNPEYVKSAPNIRDDQVVAALMTAAAAAATLGDEDFREPLEKLSNYPNLKVADLARKALAELDG